MYQKLERDPWFYGCLSYILPGFGQIWMGKIIRGVIIILLLIGLYASFFYFMITKSFIGFIPAIICIFIIFLLVIFNIFDIINKARLGIIKVGEIPLERKNDRWWPIFLSSLLGSFSVGIGYLYLKKWLFFIIWLFLLILIKTLIPTRFKLADLIQAIFFISVIFHFLILSKTKYGNIEGCAARNFIIFLITISIFELLITFIPYPFSIHFAIPDAVSMEPTLSGKEYRLNYRWAYWKNTPQTGDIIVIESQKVPKYIEYKKKYSQKYPELLCKRIVAKEGDNVIIDDFQVYVNGKLANFGLPPEKLNKKDLTPSARTFIVPKSEYFVLGDNFYDSLDSRYWGTVPREAIKGKVIKIIWPLSRARLL